MIVWRASVGLWLCSWLGLAAATNLPPTPEAIAKLPPVAAQNVDFSKDVKPILEASCIKCHGRGKSRGDWKLDTRESFLQPGESGTNTFVGDSANSRLIHLVAGTDPDDTMPKKGSKLTSQQVGVLRAWIDQGVKWDAAVTFAKPPAKNLKPRQPTLPKGSAINPVDRWMDVYYAREKIKPAKPVDDRVFVRRAYLDVVGLLPTPDDLTNFDKDHSRDKRANLVRKLLADKQRYAQHWLSFWNDLLRNDYSGTGYIDDGRKPISAWLYEALRENKPYDRFVTELINPVKGSEGFSKGIVWRGVVNASMTPPMQAAQNISQVFMGINLKCASCHDSFIDDWQLSDSYGLAGIYADGPLEMVLCDKPTGKFAPLKFLFPELGSIDGSAPKTNRQEQLARIITSRDNGRLPRTIVNRLWAKLMGRGLVEPLDVMQNDAWNPDLLDWLAEDLVTHDWNLKRTMELILTSRAYQMPSVDLPEKPDPHFAFHGPGVRRLTAEQFRDALGSLTGVWHEKPEGGLDRLLIEGGPVKPLAADAFWIWTDSHAAEGAPPGTNWFRKTVVLNSAPTEAVMFVHVDNSAKVYINGQRAPGGDAKDWLQPGVYDARPLLKAGTNVIAIEAINDGAAVNPAGLMVYAKVRSKIGAVEHITDFATDGSWLASTNHTDNWRDPDHPPDWPAAQVVGSPSIAPWNAEIQLLTEVSGPGIYGKVRASLVSADPLAVALGRPNREQVVTARQQTATTIQALELTNGGSLADLLKRGSTELVQHYSDGKTLTDRLFRQGLSRPPSRAEMKIALELIGEKPNRDGVEDLLWSIAMLPEFQLTY
jgi:hypothetical protein